MLYKPLQATPKSHRAAPSVLGGVGDELFPGFVVVPFPAPVPVSGVSSQFKNAAWLVGTDVRKRNCLENSADFSASLPWRLLFKLVVSHRPAP